MIQSANYVKEAWDSVFALNTLVKSIEDLNKIYDACKPSPRKVVSLLYCTTDDDIEKEALGYLKKFVRALSKDNLQHFLRYATGADIICVPQINIMFNNQVGMNRRFIGHTCGSTLEVPVTYESYAVFKEEFLNLLRSGYWSMDFA